MHQAQAQNTYHQNKYAVSFSGGYSLSVGKTVNKLFEESNGELADDGYFGQLSVERKLLPWLGVRIQGTYNHNTTRNEAVVSIFKKEAVTNFLASEEVLNSFEYTPQAGDWKMYGAYVGPAFYFYSGKWEVSTYASIGKVRVESPDISLLANSTTSILTGKIALNADQNNALAGGIGASVRYPVSKSLKVFVSADAIASRVNLKNVNLSAQANNLSLTMPYDKKQNVGVVNIGFGVLFAF
jgi:hypothetical protein